jgi:hypothetical protein
MEGDFKDICLFIIHKISPGPSFPKRGIMGLDQKTIYKQRLLQKYQMFTLPNPSHQGRGLIINPLPLWERARVRCKIDFCNCLSI